MKRLHIGVTLILLVAISILTSCPTPFGYFPEEEDRYSTSETGESTPATSVATPHVLIRKAGTSATFSVFSPDVSGIDTGDSSTFASVQYDQEFILATETEDATIYYTTDGSSPSPGEGTTKKYSDGEVFDLLGNTSSLLIQAIGIKSLHYPSGEMVVPMRIDYAGASTPTFSKSSGTYSADISITLATQTEGATIYYTSTTDGSLPADPVVGNGDTYAYSGAFDVSGNGSKLTIKAITAHPDYTTSAVATANYEIVYPTAAAPVITPTTGTYTTDQTVEMSTSLSGGAIYYTVSTTSGTSPADPVVGNGDTFLYTSGISLATTDGYHEYKAITVKDGYTSSAVTTEAITMIPPGPQINIVTDNYIDFYGLPLLYTSDGFGLGEAVTTTAFRMGIDTPPADTNTWVPGTYDQVVSDVTNFILYNIGEGVHTLYVRYSDPDTGVWSDYSSTEFYFSEIKDFEWLEVTSTDMSQDFGSAAAIDGILTLAEAFTLAANEAYYDNVVLDMRGISGTVNPGMTLAIKADKFAFLGPEDNSLSLSGNSERQILQISSATSAAYIHHMGFIDGYSAGDTGGTSAGGPSAGGGGSGGGGGALGGAIYINDSTQSIDVYISNSVFANNNAIGGDSGALGSGNSYGDGGDGADPNIDDDFYMILQEYYLSNNGVPYGIDAYITQSGFIGTAVGMNWAMGGTGADSSATSGADAYYPRGGGGGGGGASEGSGGDGGNGGLFGGGGGAGYTATNAAAGGNYLLGNFGGAGGSTSVGTGAATGGGGAGVGGAIAMYYGGTLTLENNVFADNSATGGTATVVDSYPSGSNGQGLGGAVFVYGATLNGASNTSDGTNTFSSNSASTSNSKVYVE